MSRKLITRAKIIEAALFSAFKNGMGAVSLSDIAQSLQIKKASLYNYFSGKEELLCAVYEYADDFYSRVNFLDEEIFAKINSSNAQKKFKLLTEEFARAHEREPLLQICILVFSEKYFNRNCLEIFQKQKSKLKNQSLAFFKFVSAIWQKKIPISELNLLAENFTEGFFARIDFYLAQKKEVIRNNPECDAGSLFALPSDEAGIEKIASFAAEILRKIA